MTSATVSVFVRLCGNRTDSRLDPSGVSEALPGLIKPWVEAAELVQVSCREGSKEPQRAGLNASSGEPKRPKLRNIEAIPEVAPSRTERASSDRHRPHAGTTKPAYAEDCTGKTNSRTVVPHTKADEPRHTELLDETADSV